MNSYRVGLIGCGRIGQVHAESVFLNPRTTLEIVVDVVPEGAQSVVDRFGGRATSESHDVFAQGAVDFAIIASPTPTHAELLTVAMATETPVLCEKPIDLDIGVVDSIRDQAADTSSPIALGFNRRFDPSFSEVHRRVQEGQVGAVEQVIIISRDPGPPSLDYVKASGGIFRDMTIHDFDMARHLAGNISAVTAVGFNQFSREIRGENDFDAVTVVLTAESGALVTITNSRHAAHGFDQRLEVFGAKGMIRADNVHDTSVTTYSAEHSGASAPYQTIMFRRYEQSYRAELEEFLRMLETGSSNSPTFDDGREALLIANAASLSATTGQTVLLKD